MTADRAAGRTVSPDSIGDPLAALDAEARAIFAAVADHLIPEAHGMPSAGDIVGEARLRFVLTARPDLLEPIRAALRPGIGDDAPRRLEALQRDEPAAYDALISTVVFGYYTDTGVRDRLGYPGQEAKTLYSWKVPEYIEEGLTDRVLARGPVWRDPVTGRRAEAANDPQRTGGGPTGERGQETGDGQRTESGPPTEHLGTAHSNRERT